MNELRDGEPALLPAVAHALDLPGGAELLDDPVGESVRDHPFRVGDADAEKQGGARTSIAVAVGPDPLVMKLVSAFTTLSGISVPRTIMSA